METNKDYCIAPSGRVCLGEKLPDFNHAVEAALHGDAPSVILDLTHVTYMDSSGIGDILKLYLECQRKGKKFLIRNVPPTIAKVFHSAKLDKIFPIA